MISQGPPYTKFENFGIIRYAAECGQTADRQTNKQTEPNIFPRRPTLSACVIMLLAAALHALTKNSEKFSESLWWTLSRFFLTFYVVVHFRNFSSTQERNFNAICKLVKTSRTFSFSGAWNILGVTTTSSTELDFTHVLFSGEADFDEIRQRQSGVQRKLQQLHVDYRRHHVVWSNR